jgi:hemolysin D
MAGPLGTRSSTIPKKPLRAQRTDLEFLPAALEILETPPSPVRMGLILIICAFMLIALSWAYVGRIDIIATAQGKIQPAGRAKVLQSLETGKVMAISVANGAQVAPGEVLVELDPTEARAVVAGAEADLAASIAEIARRKAAIAFARSIDLANMAPSPTVPTITWGEDVPTGIRLREMAVLQGDLNQLHAELASITAEIEQKGTARQHLEATLTAQRDLIVTLKDRSSMREMLLKSNFGSKADWLDAMEKVKTQEVTLASELGQRADMEASLEVLNRDLLRRHAHFVADNLQRLADAERQADDLAQKLRQAKARLDHLTLHSPIAGIVQDSSLTTIGQVVTTGIELMRIVPTGAKLEVEAYLPNGDIGFVAVGHAASIKVEAFPFTRYGTIAGKITHVGRDAISEPDARQIESDPARPTGAGTAITGRADRTQNLVFPITVELEQDSITVGHRAVPLLPGMAVTVEIKTGKRSILEYLLSPVVEVASGSMRER